MSYSWKLCPRIDRNGDGEIDRGREMERERKDTNWLPTQFQYQTFMHQLPSFCQLTSEWEGREKLNEEERERKEEEKFRERERTEQARMMMIPKTRPLKFSSVSGRVRKIGRDGEGEKEKKTVRKEEREREKSWSL